MTQDLKLIVGARLRAARHAKKLTQSQLADAVSRTVEAVSNIERGLSLPPLAVLRAATLLGVALADLVAAPADEGGLRERAVLEAQARTIVATLPLAQLRAAIRQLEALADL